MQLRGDATAKRETDDNVLSTFAVRVTATSAATGAAEHHEAQNEAAKHHQ
jgi:hypothetical protein